MAGKRVVLKGKVTPFNKCVARKIRGKKFKSRKAQRSAWKRATKACGRRY